MSIISGGPSHPPNGLEEDSTNGYTPRKKRKLSHASSDDDDNDRAAAVPKVPVRTASRIKPRKGPRQVTHAPVLEATEVSNGKVVDAKSSFATLGVRPWLLASLTAMAIYRPTAIQKGCIPEILRGSDVIGGSKTGSGKTISFAVPILQKWAEDSMAVFAVVLTPTRCDSLFPFSSFIDQNVESWRFKYWNSFKRCPPCSTYGQC